MRKMLYSRKEMEKNSELIKKLRHYEEEHRDLDEIITALHEKKTVNLSQIQRLKKRKLGIKDRIANLKDKIEPDIIA